MIFKSKLFLRTGHYIWEYIKLRKAFSTQDMQSEFFCSVYNAFGQKNGIKG